MSDYGNMGEDIGKLVNFLLWAVFLLGLMLVFACCTSLEICATLVRGPFSAKASLFAIMW